MSRKKLIHKSWSGIGAISFYFAHSYAAPASAQFTVAACDHGFPFAAVIERQNLAAVQFHPEKSGETGAQVLRNFVESVL